MKKIKSLIWLVLFISANSSAQVCPYDSRCINNPYGAGSPYNPNGVNNPYSPQGSPYSNQSATNPYAIDAPSLYDSQGNYHGRLSANPYDADSISNPYSRYGSPYSSDNINNPSAAESFNNTSLMYVVPTSRNKY